MLTRMSIVPTWSVGCGELDLCGFVHHRTARHTVVAYFSGLHPVSHMTDGDGDSR